MFYIIQIFLLKYSHEICFFKNLFKIFLKNSLYVFIYIIKVTIYNLLSIYEKNNSFL